MRRQCVRRVAYSRPRRWLVECIDAAARMLYAVTNPITCREASYGQGRFSQGTTTEAGTEAQAYTRTRAEARAQACAKEGQEVTRADAAQWGVVRVLVQRNIRLRLAAK